MEEILVVDDDALMRELIAEWLTLAGYRTRVAANGEGALVLLRERAGDLVITDLNMPRLGGTEAVARIRQACPGVPLIVVSAHLGSERQYSPQALLALGAQRALAKPLKRQQLLTVVREVLAAAPR